MSEFCQQEEDKPLTGNGLERQRIRSTVGPFGRRLVLSQDFVRKRLRVSPRGFEPLTFGSGGRRAASSSCGIRMAQTTCRSCLRKNDARSLRSPHFQYFTGNPIEYHQFSDTSRTVRALNGERLNGSASPAVPPARAVSRCESVCKHGILCK